MKDLDDEQPMTGFEDIGKYCGQNPIISILKKDAFKIKLEGRQIETSRWAMCKVKQELRNEVTSGESDGVAQFYDTLCSNDYIRYQKNCTNGRNKNFGI